MVLVALIVLLPIADWAESLRLRRKLGAMGASILNYPHRDLGSGHSDDAAATGGCRALWSVGRGVDHLFRGGHCHVDQSFFWSFSLAIVDGGNDSALFHHPQRRCSLGGRILAWCRPVAPLQRGPCPRHQLGAVHLAPADFYHFCGVDDHQGPGVIMFAAIGQASMGSEESRTNPLTWVMLVIGVTATDLVVFTLNRRTRELMRQDRAQQDEGEEVALG